MSETSRAIAMADFRRDSSRSRGGLKVLNEEVHEVEVIDLLGNDNIFVVKDAEEVLANVAREGRPRLLLIAHDVHGHLFGGRLGRAGLVMECFTYQIILLYFKIKGNKETLDEQ